MLDGEHHPGFAASASNRCHSSAHMRAPMASAENCSATCCGCYPPGSPSEGRDTGRRRAMMIGSGSDIHAMGLVDGHNQTPFA